MGASSIIDSALGRSEEHSRGEEHANAVYTVQKRKEHAVDEELRKMESWEVKE